VSSVYVVSSSQCFPALGESSRPACGVDEFKCSNRRCVPAVQLCDNHDDCGDRSDELGCRMCIHFDTFSF